MYLVLLDQEQESAPVIKLAKGSWRIADVVKSFDNELREDAMLLLHLLVEKMLVLPLLRGEQIADLGELRSDLEIDLKVIVKHAFRNEKGEISGGSLLRSIAYCYPNLKVVQNAWWE